MRGRTPVALAVREPLGLAGLRPVRPPTIAELVVEWRRHLKVGRSLLTVRTYTSGIRAFIGFLEAGGVAPAATFAHDLPAVAVERFIIALSETALGRSTWRTYAAGVRSYLRFAYRRGWGPRDATHEQLSLGVGELLGRQVYVAPVLNRALPRLLVYIDGLPLPARGEPARRLQVLRDKAIVAVLFCSGLRRAELCGLDRAQLDDGWADQALIRGKGGKQRLAYFDSGTLERIRAYLSARHDTYAPLFLSHRRARGAPGPNGERYRLEPQSVWFALREHAKRIGIEVHPHDFRHLKATMLLNAGAKLEEVQDLLGHADPRTTKLIYAHYSQQHLREAFDRYSVPLEEVLGA